jgi:hypothetical protein
MLGRPPRINVSPYAYGSPYGYGRSYGMSAGYGYGGFPVGGYRVFNTAPVAARRVGTARIGATSNVGRASTVAGRPAPATYRAPVRNTGRDVSFSRVQAARQQFQRQYGFSD